ncbi:Putative small GTP-binding protein [Septoria linicola]|uniref:Small GTP-binding protein n=1 Tax=Septoria linicola TaxID=215465 RepID=A0A9Q9AZK4_9PEZI|nr:putative small GTP-binding protein [Septoria linicola]USW55420.1 Putative small GTP-binding protein [Septoria linicola]
MANPPPSLEAKLVVLGSQGVGKTSLVHRYVKNSFIEPNKAQSTVGASFLTTRVHDPETGAQLRLQIWDTAGQERFRSISRLYYRGANAAILCYDVTSKKSFEDMGVWLKELRENCGGQEVEEDMILHIVGTKSDVVAADPSKREVPFERCIGYVAEQLLPPGQQAGSTSPQVVPVSSPPSRHGLQAPAQAIVNSPNSNRSSGFWGQSDNTFVWDCCHEISAKDGEGIEEVFRVVTRKLIEQNAKRQERLRMLEEMSVGKTPGLEGGAGTPGCYFELPHNGNGSFRLGHGDKRKSWLIGALTPGGMTNYSDHGVEEEVKKGMKKGRCC